MPMTACVWFGVDSRATHMDCLASTRSSRLAAVQMVNISCHTLRLFHRMTRNHARNVEHVHGPNNVHTRSHTSRSPTELFGLRQAYLEDWSSSPNYHSRFNLIGDPLNSIAARLRRQRGNEMILYVNPLPIFDILLPHVDWLVWWCRWLSPFHTIQNPFDLVSIFSWDVLPIVLLQANACCLNCAWPEYFCKGRLLLVLLLAPSYSLYTWPWMSSFLKSLPRGSRLLRM